MWFSFTSTKFDTNSNIHVYFIRYMDLNCPEVENVLTILLIFSCACNGLGALVVGWYAYLHWGRKSKRPKYVQVRTNTIPRNNPLNRPIYKSNLEERWRFQILWWTNNIASVLTWFVDIFRILFTSKCTKRYKRL